ncbi:hypothetical protein SEUCBS140593_007410 [Sporothrix eucalyptigena]|uniref:Ankyrin repeat protein n=1 Tax=Sporothrix eucalyptigena TaxID=1812306 RepID=A0ABP0CFR4_9PEZI
MQSLRLMQASGSKSLGTPLPDNILNLFTVAVTAGDLDAIQTLLKEHFFNGSRYLIYELYPVLSQAARHDQVEIVKEIFVRDPFSFATEDFVAREAIDAGSGNTLLFLLKYGWDINGRIQPGLTVLETLLHHGGKDRDMVIWLIAHSASLNERPRHIDFTGMSQAVEHASLPLVQELLDEYGGDVLQGQLLHHALKRGSRAQSRTQPESKPPAANDIVEMLGLLVERGAPLNLTLYANDGVSSYNFRISDHGTPLHEAAQMGHVEAVRYLLAQGADTSITSTRSKTTALAWAEKAGHKDVVAILRSPEQYKL